jgi:hypothetical protein
VTRERGDLGAGSQVPYPHGLVVAGGEAKQQVNDYAGGSPVPSSVDLWGTCYNTNAPVEALETLLRKRPDPAAYADPFHRLEETVSEDSMRLHRALPQPKATMSYTYDLGATWRHQIVLEKVLDDHPLPHPECRTGQGDNPIEYYDPDDPADPVPFDGAAINELLNGLATAGY